MNKVYNRILNLVTESPLDSRHWRTWPLDPNDPSRGTLSAQKTSSQEVQGGGGGKGLMAQKKRRTRVTKPADNLGIKGTQTHHTTTSNTVTTIDPNTKGRHTLSRSMASKPLKINRRTSVKGMSNGKQIRVSNFPTYHSSNRSNRQTS